MHLTQGTFSYLPPLDDEQIERQIRYAMENGWSLSVEYTDDPHPRNVYWNMWGHPLFEMEDPEQLMREIRGCREAHADGYIRVNAYDARYGRQTTALSFIVQRPADEPGFRVQRQEGAGRVIRYELHPYVADRPHGQRYGARNGD